MKPENEIMIPTMLKAAGYVTAQVGKWHQLPLQPSDWGFDEYLRFPGSGCYWRAQTATYTENGATKNLPEGVYLPDVMHEFLVDFLQRHKQQPFYVHYAMSHVHNPIVRTPDSVPGSQTLYADNIAYMDKLVGNLVVELDHLHLRETPSSFSRAITAPLDASRRQESPCMAVRSRAIRAPCSKAAAACLSS